MNTVIRIWDNSTGLELATIAIPKDEELKMPDLAFEARVQLLICNRKHEGVITADVFLHGKYLAYTVTREPKGIISEHYFRLGEQS